MHSNVGIFLEIYFILSFIMRFTETNKTFSCLVVITLKAISRVLTPQVWYVGTVTHFSNQTRQESEYRCRWVNFFLPPSL